MHPTHHPLHVRLPGPASSSLSPEDRRHIRAATGKDSLTVQHSLFLSRAVRWFQFRSSTSRRPPCNKRWTTLLPPQRLPQFLGTVVTHAAGRLKVRPQCLSCLASAFPAVVHLVTDTNLISTQTPITLINRLSEHTDTDGTILSRPPPPRSSPP